MIAITISIITESTLFLISARCSRDYIKDFLRVRIPPSPRSPKEGDTTKIKDPRPPKKKGIPLKKNLRNGDTTTTKKSI